MATPFVSIVMPALNEASHIEAAIATVRPVSQEIDYEVLVVDGGSDDGTQAIVSLLQQADARIRLIHNPRRIQAAALNMAAQLADPRADILVRADCHASYPCDFVMTCVRTMRAKGVASVVVPMETAGRSCMQRAIATAQNSRLGNGGSLHRTAGASGYVEHGHHAAFDRAAFVAIGGYSENMSANEDAEFDRRLVAAGHRIWLCGEATITYFPRRTLRALARQYFSYGYGRASTCLRHGAAPKLRQLVPVAALLGCSASILLSFVDGRFLLLALSYIALCLFWGLALAWRDKALCAALSGVAGIVMHMSWGAGFCTRLAGEMARRVRAKRPAESREADSPPV